MERGVDRVAPRGRGTRRGTPPVRARCVERAELLEAGYPGVRRRQVDRKPRQARRPQAHGRQSGPSGALGTHRPQALVGRPQGRVVRPQGRVGRPQARIDIAGIRRALGQPRLDDAEQVVDAVLQREGVALDVEEQVARGRLGKAEQPAVGLQRAVGQSGRRQQLMLDPTLVLALDLDAGLLAHGPQPLLPHARGAGQRRVERDGHGGQLPPRVHRRLVLAERAALLRRDAGHERQVVVLAPPRLALHDPAAHVAVLDGFGSGERRIDGDVGRCGGRGSVRGRSRIRRPICRRAAGGDERLEASAHQAVVGQVVGRAKVLDGVRAPAQRDVHLRRPDALEPLQQVGVEAELEQRRRLHVPRELGVPGFVAPRTQLARGLDAAEEVGETEPADAAAGTGRRFVPRPGFVSGVARFASRPRPHPVPGRGLASRPRPHPVPELRSRALEERGLVDHVDAGPHGLERPLGSRPVPGTAILDRVVLGDLDDAAAFLAQALEEPVLVLEAALGDSVELGVGAHGALDQPGEGGAFEVREVLAGEEADEVGGGADGRAVDQLHGDAVTMSRCVDSGRRDARVVPSEAP